MGCALSREQLMVWSIKNSNTRKATSALKMGLLINGPLNVRARLLTADASLVTTGETAAATVGNRAREVTLVYGTLPAGGGRHAAHNCRAGR